MSEEQQFDPQMPEQSDQADQSEQSEQGTKYVLDKKSESDEVVVDDKVLTKSSKPVALTQEEYDRVSNLDGVVLTEADEETGE